MIVIGALLIAAAMLGGVAIFQMPMGVAGGEILVALAFKWAAAVIAGLAFLSGCVLVGAGYICAELVEIRKLIRKD